MTKQLPYWELGLSGFLAPDGQFFACAYSEHQKLAYELVKQYNIDVEIDIDSEDMPDYDFIKFGCSPLITSKKGDHMCHVFLSSIKKPTEEQLKWLDIHWIRMTYNQSLQLLFALQTWGLAERYEDKHQKIKNFIKC